MTTDEIQDLLADADRVVSADLYPVRCREVIAKLTAALREKPPVSVRFTYAKDDADFWLHMTLPDGKAAGINLGNPKGMITTACLRALVDGEPT